MNSLRSHRRRRRRYYMRGEASMSKSVLRLGKVTYGTKDREEAFYEALAPYFEEMKLELKKSEEDE